MTVDDWRERARRLADDLDRAGVLGAGWREAFEQIPRHVFVPAFFTNGDVVLDGADPARRDEWLDAIYADTSLVTQRAEVPGTGLFLPTSSSTVPSLMARMLALLDVAPHDRVLEVGTGTGYNAALLCHRLGDTHLTSVDIDPRLVDTARARLASLGYRPHLITGDGAHGAPDHAPYSRLIATAAVGTVPGAWVTQLAPHGLAVVDVRGEIASSLTVLHKTDSDTLTGRFLGVPGHFMWLRADAANPLRHGGTMNTEFDRRNPRTLTTTIAPADLINPEFGFVLQFTAPDLRWIGQTTANDGTPILSITTDDNSWAEVATDAIDESHRVLCGGPGDVWSRVAEAWQAWQGWHRPHRTRLGVTAHTDGQQEIWLDDPHKVII